MNENEIINISGVECYEKEGTVYLKLETVARGLGFTRVAESGNEVVRWERVDKYLNGLGVPTCGHDDFIPENIFYRLAMKAKNEVAEAFQAKIADEVIPSIRKHGGYLAGQETMSDMEVIANALQIAQRVLDERDRRIKEQAGIIERQAETIEVQDQVIGELKPKGSYYDAILTSKDTVAIGQIAADYGLTANALNKILAEEGVQFKVNRQWLLKKEHRDKGYTQSYTHKYTHRNGEVGTQLFTRWTQQGRLFIHALLNKRGIEALMDREDSESAEE